MELQSQGFGAPKKRSGGGQSRRLRPGRGPVMVRRDGPDHGATGKVAAARNGYLIVRSTGAPPTSARDLCKVRVGADGSVERLPIAVLTARARGGRPGRRQPGETAGAGAARPLDGGRQAAGGREASRRGRRLARDDRPRLSWRDNVVDEDYEVPQHEHS